MSFDPFFEKDGNKLYRIKEWPGNISRITFPAGILSSDNTKRTNVINYTVVLNAIIYDYLYLKLIRLVLHSLKRKYETSI